MAIQFMDGFDLYNVIADFALKPGVNQPSGALQLISPGRFGGRAMESSFFQNAICDVVLGSGNTKSVGFAYRMDTVANCTTGAAFLYFRGTGGTVDVCKLGVDVNGALVMGRGDFTTNKICNSANGVIVANTWAYIEIELTRSATVGAVTVYVNGVSVCAASAANTGAVAVDSIRWGLGPIAGANATRDTDDFYITDTATRLGESRIDVLRPSADTATADWTPLSGTRASNVDDTTQDGDTTYVSDATVGHKDLYDVANLPISPTTVRAVQTILFARKDDAALRQIRNNLKSGTTAANGTTRTLGSSYAMFTDLYELDPNTAAAWTGTTVNAAQLGLELVT